MLFEPNAFILDTLLSSSRIHGNVDLGKQAAKHIFNLEPKDALVYVLLSNIYAPTRWWDCLSNVRKNMTKKGLKKVTNSHLD